MANSLNLNLKQGEEVVLTNNQIVYCQGGFGMCSSTIGTAIYVEDKEGKRFRISGWDIKCLVKRRNEMDEVLQAIINLKTLALKQVVRYPATFRALDVVEKIAGWERASVSGDDSFYMAKKVCKIYQETIDNLKGRRE